MMTETQFLMALNKTTTAYTWTVEGKKIVGTAKITTITTGKIVQNSSIKMDPCSSSGSG